MPLDGPEAPSLAVERPRTASHLPAAIVPTGGGPGAPRSAGCCPPSFPSPPRTPGAAAVGGGARPVRPAQTRLSTVPRAAGGTRAQTRSAAGKQFKQDAASRKREGASAAPWPREGVHMASGAPHAPPSPAASSHSAPRARSDPAGSWSRAAVLNRTSERAASRPASLQLESRSRGIQRASTADRRSPEVSGISLPSPGGDSVRAKLSSSFLTDPSTVSCGESRSSAFAFGDASGHVAGDEARKPCSVLTRCSARCRPPRTRQLHASWPVYRPTLCIGRCFQR